MEADEGLPSAVHAAARNGTSATTRASTGTLIVEVGCRCSMDEDELPGVGRKKSWATLTFRIHRHARA